MATASQAAGSVRSKSPARWPRRMICSSWAVPAWWGAGLPGRVPGEGGAEQEGVAANELPADVEEPAQRVGGRGGVEVGGVDGGDGFGSQGLEEGGDQGVA